MVDDRLSGLRARPSGLEARPSGDVLESPRSPLNVDFQRAIRECSAAAHSIIKRLAKLGIFTAAFLLLLPMMLIVSVLAICVALSFGIPIHTPRDVNAALWRTNRGHRSTVPDRKRSGVNR